MYTLTNSLAPLTKKYIDVYNELQLYSGLADTTTYTAVINDNFYNCLKKFCRERSIGT